MATRIAVDVGGTFTDLALVDLDNNLRISKSPTTPADHAQGVLNCVDLVAEQMNRPAQEVMGECNYFAHGSTIVTNAVIEGKVAKIGLLLTKGFRDILTCREGGKDDPVQYARGLCRTICTALPDPTGDRADRCRGPGSGSLG